MYPPAHANVFRAVAGDAQTVHEVDWGGPSDAEIVDSVASEGCGVLTEDVADFGPLSAST